jgi:LuxR family maltose regulon positive regulatory protein
VGNHGAAAAVVDWTRRRAGDIAEVLLMRAWTEAAAGHHEAAAAFATVLERGAAPVLLAHTPLEVLLVRVEAELQRGDGAAARATLGAALAAGRSLDVVRPFALAGKATRAALAARRRQAERDPFLARVVAVLTVVSPEITTPLSEREQAVLALLPSLLTAREIAAELTVSVNTVKTHIRSIYAKLSVAGRRDAVQRARARGLLP